MIIKFPEQQLIDLLQSHKSLNTFELRARGFCTPNTNVHSLRKAGVPIKTTLRDAIGESGRVHRRVAHYSLGGSTHE
ncbi:MAG: hypothetical protein JJU10_11125 [Idiomarina sp.]|nr:hypothetical protein [Idiomarina sp.]